MEESRDISKPYSPEELEILKKLFRGMPTFTDEGYVLSSDIPAIWKGMGINRAPEEAAIAKACWDKYSGGILTFSQFVEGSQITHDPAAFAKFLGRVADTDKSGCIARCEFANLLELLVVMNPKLEKFSFEQFVEEADTNADGKVTTEECGNWIEGKLKNL